MSDKTEYQQSFPLSDGKDLIISINEDGVCFDEYDIDKDKVIRAVWFTPDDIKEKFLSKDGYIKVSVE